MQSARGCLNCNSILILQSGRRAFALAAEHGCVDMLEMLTEPYEMATMKPNKVCALAFSVRLLCILLQHVTVCTLLRHACCKAL